MLWRFSGPKLVGQQLAQRELRAHAARGRRRAPACLASANSRSAGGSRRTACTGASPSPTHDRTAVTRLPPAATIAPIAFASAHSPMRIGRVLDVAAGVHAALLVEHRGADGEARIGRVRAALRRARRLEAGVDLLRERASSAFVQCSFTYGRPERRRARRCGR